MKNIKRIILSVIFIGLGLASCSDEFLERAPFSSVGVGEAITNETTLNTQVLGLYSVMQDTDDNTNGDNTGFGGYYNSVQALITDDGYVSLQNSNRFVGVYDYTAFLPDITTITSLIWNDLYEVVNSANFIISFDNGSIADETGVSGTPNQKFAEARVARAYSFFMLVNFYSRPAQSGIDQNLGVPLPLEWNQGQTLPRSTVQEVYNQIIDDLTTAITLFDDQDNPGVVYRLGSTAAELLLSRVHLNLGNYQDVVTYSDRVLNNDGGYTLMPMNEVVSFYEVANENSPENIFSLEFNPSDTGGSNDAFAATWGFGGTYEQNFATRGFYDLIPSTDVRKGLYNDNIPVADYPDALLGVDVRKFTALDRDIPQFRMSEAILNKIEALYFTNEAQARTELNSWVSTYRNSSYNTAASGSALLDEIKKERRIEFAFEAQRWFDMNRWEETIVRDANCRQNCDPIPFANFRRVFPIPQSEIDANTEISDEDQNSGY